MAPETSVSWPPGAHPAHCSLEAFSACPCPAGRRPPALPVVRGEVSVKGPRLADTTSFAVLERAQEREWAWEWAGTLLLPASGRGPPVRREIEEQHSSLLEDSSWP